jgi:hypothetical protein
MAITVVAEGASRQAPFLRSARSAWNAGGDGGDDLVGLIFGGQRGVLARCRSVLVRTSRFSGMEKRDDLAPPADSVLVGRLQSTWRGRR